MKRWMWLGGLFLGGAVLAAGVRGRPSLPLASIDRCAATAHGDENDFGGANAVRRPGEPPRRHHRVRHGRSARR